MSQSSSLASDRCCIVIPARLASTRLPEKLLLNETGRTLIEHTYRAACQATIPSLVIVAVDHPRLFEAVTAFDGRVELTDVNAQSGTDRVAEVAARHSEYELWINVQGDEPEISGEAIDRVAQLLRSDPEASVATLATPIRRRENLEDPNCVKVVRDRVGRALYFSRSPIPFPRQWDDTMLGIDPPLFLQHLGIYAYRSRFLAELASLPPSPLEQTEKLEQLRFLQAGHAIAVGVIDHAPRGIDTRPDYEAFVARCRQSDRPPLVS